ncbi:phospho-sugar mutase [Mycobacterium lepromatosis]|uniref:phospho-sugar mutase n=1 Tax=Mycobacterium lepromatosis TaxID=480418 RepID=UPI0005F847D8|nr:phospho-sugar mutase [Mycobacterium lepromatosis]UKN42042.1 phosphomannomutase [Mycobacterium lepromatosis]
MTPEEWIAHDPDPQTAAELAACDPDELAARFARALRFGTSGLRGPVRGGPDAMNLAVVLRATWAVAQVLMQRGGSRPATVIVGRDSRHGSAVFVAATAEVLAAEGFSVLLLPDPAPTPVVAFAVRNTGAAAGIQITASHNPPSDNGYKVYFDGGIQIISPTERQIETAMAAAPLADQITRKPVNPSENSASDLVDHYIQRAAAVRRSNGSVRVALTPMHGVGGAVAVETLRRTGFDDVHTVAAQFAPDPDFPTVTFPNPEEPGATDALLTLATHIGADVAIALDPDADRCAVGVPTSSGWRMLSGDETGWLLGDYILSQTDKPETAVVASTVVSSRMLAAIAAHYHAVHVETRTGFKWLARADANLPGTLVYAYEEAIGHCVDPTAVRDKDGISAAVLVCDLVAALHNQGRSVPDMLDQLAQRHGVHEVTAISRRIGLEQAGVDETVGLMRRLRAAPPSQLAGFTATTTDTTDALIFTGGDDDTWVRVVVRPSGTEPKLKCYLEVRCPVAGDLPFARQRARVLRDELVTSVRQW